VGAVVVIRQGTQVDVDAAAAIWGAAIAGHLAGRYDPGDHVAELRARLAQPGSFWVVAEDDGDLVGAAVGLRALAGDGAGPEVVPGLCHVTMVCVAPGHWGQGIGGAIMDALLAEASARGFSAAQLWADPSDPRATRLYLSRGFAASGRCGQGALGEEIAHYRMALLP
jgi:ribosomal protein S18 acetylase RimI-like enzyme